MSERHTQVKRLTTPEAFRDHVASLGVEIPFDDVVDPAGVLSTPTSFTDGQAGTLTAVNRFAVLPMEGWDGTTDGRPTDLVRRRWSRFAASGAGIVWGEATAVRPDGRANPNQLVMGERSVDEIAALRASLAPGQVAGLQLTHSGRYARPVQAPEPRTAYQHPVLDARVGAGPHTVFTDDELDELVEQYVAAAVLTAQAGFEFVDVKHCHGYFLHELLSGHDRPGPYGGDLAGRTHFLCSVVAGIRDRAPGLAVAVRLSAFDLMPFTAGEGGTGVPDGEGPYRHAFGGDGTGLGIDLTEVHQLFAVFEELGIGLVSTTAGSPYYNPHVQRPAYFPPSDGYRPPEDPLVGVARQLAVTAELAAAHPEVTVIGSGYSYLQDWLPNVGQAVVAGGGAAMVGLGRMVLSYPELPLDVLAGRSVDRGLICRTFSDCTTAPRNGLVSGCFPIDPFYKDHPQRVELTKAKQAAKARLR
ncbi:NADH:flavin oxidoreductase [Aquihabitans sp. G128]|uniref:oxidoreductase n=1 Tax=Aquihabitans sp. G128 TaxID=2849779 RepID=UPI001C21DB32|nr:NADH:flavin oxidoreductase [Aquihabitans sp. G128]QXC59392.1 NADH:flavin oxidoreductase [Aquihabitans sp. G128]